MSTESHGPSETTRDHLRDLRGAVSAAWNYAYDFGITDWSGQLMSVLDGIDEQLEEMTRGE